MRQRHLAAGGLPAGLHHHHRLGVGGGAQCAHEAPRVADAFHVDQDALRAGVAGQEVQHLRQVDHRVGPQRDHGREAHAVLACPVQHGRGQRARLRHQRQRPARCQRSQAADIQLQRRPLQAQAVRSQQVDAVAPRDQLQFGADRRRQAAGQDQRGAAADAAGDLHRRHHLIGRQRDHGQIGPGVRQVGQRAAGADVQPGDGAGIGPWPGQRGMHGAGLAGGFGSLRQGRLAGQRRAHERHDRSRVEQRCEEVAVHGGQSALVSILTVPQHRPAGTALA